MNSVFKALNDQTRREILSLLREKDHTAGDIAAHFDISKPSISHHLDILKTAGLITSVKKGQFIIYSINTTVVEELFEWIYTLKNKSHEVSAEKGNSAVDHTSASDNLPGN